MGAGSGNGGDVTVPVGLAAAVATLIPALQQHIPPEPAAVLGRLGAAAPTSPLHQMPQDLDPAGERTGMRPRRHPSGRTLVAIRNGGGRGRPESAAMASLRGLDPFVTERLLGALELTVQDLRPTIPVGMIVALPQQRGLVAVAGTGSDGAVLRAVGRLDAIRPGLSDSVISLARALAGSGTGTDDGPAGADQGADPTDRDESSVAGRHGARILALGVATAAVVMAAQDPPYVNGPAVIGAGIAAAADLLREAPMPPEYADAQLERRRADYLMPRSSVASVVVQDNEFALVEAATDVRPDFSRNGLVDVVPGGVVVRTGIEQGQSTCYLRVVAEEPELEDGAWDEIVDLSWTATTGSATAAGLRDATPPWPGEYRTRVCADGRDRGQERYEIIVWAASTEPEVVHKVSDRLGAQLRGDTAAANRAEPPEAGYRWVTNSALADAGTVTVVVDSTPDKVLRAFGADPAEPMSLAKRLGDYGIDPWVAVAIVGQTVLAVEFNGWQGSRPAVLRDLSTSSRAASMYWSVNNNGTLSIADSGTLLGSGELGMQRQQSAELDAALEGIDLDDFHDTVAKGFVALERLSGVPFRPEHLAAVLADDVGYPILPRLPEQYTRQRAADGSLRWPGHGPLASSTDALLAIDDDRLHELAWWIAGQTTTAAGLADHPAVLESIATRTLTEAAEQLTRRSELQGHSAHRQMWLTVYGATNPDPLSAVFDASEAAQHAVRPADDLLAVIQERVAEL